MRTSAESATFAYETATVVVGGLALTLGVLLGVALVSWKLGKQGFIPAPPRTPALRLFVKSKDYGRVDSETESGEHTDEDDEDDDEENGDESDDDEDDEDVDDGFFIARGKIPALSAFLGRIKSFMPELYPKTPFVNLSVVLCLILIAVERAMNIARPRLFARLVGDLTHGSPPWYHFGAWAASTLLWGWNSNSPLDSK